MADVAAGHNGDSNAPYEIVSCSTKPFPSLPLFLPRNVTYDPRTNTVTSPPSSSSASSSRQAHSPNDYDEHLVIVENAGLDMLHKVNRPIGCVSCVGPYRTGKSLLLSRFLNSSKSFKLGPTLEGCTRCVHVHAFFLWLEMAVAGDLVFFYHAYTYTRLFHVFSNELMDSSSLRP